MFKPKEGEWYTAGAKKNENGTTDLSHAASFKLGKIQEGEAGQQSGLIPEQQEIASANKSKNEAFFESLERSGGLELQEATNNVRDLTEKLKMFKKDPLTSNDVETINWYEREIELNQRVVNGEKLTDVLSSMQSKEDKKRIEIEREKIKNMRQE